MKIWVFLPLAFVWPSKFFLAFFQFSWPSDVLIIQNHSNLSYFEAILLLKTVFADNLTKCISVQSSAEESFKIALIFRIIALYFLDKINYSWPQ